MNRLKNKKIFYLIVFLFWTGLLLLRHPCNYQGYPIFEIWLVSVVSLFFISAWHASYKEKLIPNNFINATKLSVNASLELMKVFVIFFLLSLPLIILIPAYSCYSDRTRNSESLAFLGEAKINITRLISENGNLNNDYSNIHSPIDNRLDYFNITSEGIIQAHYNTPEFTVYLEPKMAKDEITWSCKAFPPKKAPSVCR